MTSMTGSCGVHREYLSADLDGEIDPASDPESGAALLGAQRHMTACADCERWFAGVTHVNRLARTEVADPGPGFSEVELDELLAQLPSPGTGRVWRRAARVSLALVGVVQVVLGALPLVLPHASGLDPHAAIMRDMDVADMGVRGMDASGGMLSASMIHMSHEYAAWSLAVGIGFLVGARWTRHLAGALPVLASFAAVLFVVTAVDAVSGRVEPARAVSHLLIMVGIALIVAILAIERAHPHPSTGSRLRRKPSLFGGHGIGHGAGYDTRDQQHWRADRARGEGLGPRPAAHHDVA